VSAILTGADIYIGTSDVIPPSGVMPVSITAAGNFEVGPSWFFSCRLTRATKIRLEELKQLGSKSNVAQTKQRHKTA
jgi:hypothetical protein